MYRKDEVLVFRIAAASLLLAVLVNGIRVTRHLDWPAGPDMFRDLGAAEVVKQTAKRSAQLRIPLADPNYAGEAFWYNPLTPSIVAAVSAWAHIPVHIVETRAGSYLNIATPLAFYMLATTVSGHAVGFAALAAFLFFQPFSSWESATYSPWLLVSNFAQAFFYLTMAAWVRYRSRPGLTTATAAGLSLGLTVLAHAAPAAILGVVMTAGTIEMMTNERRDPVAFGRVAARSGLIVAIAAVTATPVWMTLFHYRGHIRNPLPFLWLAPFMDLTHIPSFLMLNARRYLLNAGIALGLVSLARTHPSPERASVIAWYLGALLLFVWSAYAWRVFDVDLLTRLAIAPAHHFLVYLRACEALLFGIGTVAVLRASMSRLAPGRVMITSIAITAVTATLVAAHLPSYLRREDFTAYPRESASAFVDPVLHSTIDWIARHTRVNDVFLAPEDAALSLVSSLGRKVVIVDRFFSNPFVDWDQRDAARSVMWKALVAADCSAFRPTADAYRVSYVLTVDGETPLFEVPPCGLTRVFASGPFAIYRRHSP